MAKRKRKMTLFDVINTGPAKGMQVRHRVPTYQPVPELPVQKKLAKLFGRRGSKGAEDRPLTAAEELEQLRRELAPPPTPEPVMREVELEPEPEPIVKKPVPRVTTRVVEYEPSPEEVNREPAPPMSVADRVRMLAAEADADEPVREPKRPLGERFAGIWQKVTPHLATAGRSVGRATSGSVIGLRTQASKYRDLQSRYGVTAITFASVMALFIGSFYVGKFLLGGRTVEPLASNGSNVRSDVLDLTRGSATDGVIGNVNSGGRNDATLVRPPQDGSAVNANAPAAAVFGNRDLTLNYVIIQSCATAIDAQTTVETLARHKVDATVETGLGFNPYLPFAVVSKRGFVRINGNAELNNFMATLRRISDREAGNSVRDPFDPHPFKYKVQQR